MASILDQITIEDTYELFFPGRKQGLVVIWLYERMQNKQFENGIFRESDIQQAFREVNLLDKQKIEREQWADYNRDIMKLQEFFLFYNDENQTYTFKEYATYLCEKISKILTKRFNPTIIEVTCTDLYHKLLDCTDQIQLNIWLQAHFDKAKLHLKEQIDYLDQQIDKSLTDLSETARLRNNSILTALRDIENKIDEIRAQNNELRGAFREIDRIKTILLTHPARDENPETDDAVSSAIDYFDSINTLLGMVDTRLDKIQPRVQQFFGSLKRQLFDSRVEKFLMYLLENTTEKKGELIFPIANEPFIVRLPQTDLTLVENKGDLFPGKRNSAITYIHDPEKEAKAFQSSPQALVRQSHISRWLEKIKRESLHQDSYHLSDTFFRILSEHNDDLQLAVQVIYQAITIYNKHEKWYTEIDRNKEIKTEQSKHTIWDIWIKRK